MLFFVLHEAVTWGRKSGNFFVLTQRFLGFYFLLYEKWKSLQPDPIWWHYALRKCIQILNPDLKEIPE